MGGSASASAGGVGSPVGTDSVAWESVSKIAVVSVSDSWTAVASDVASSVA